MGVCVLNKKWKTIPHLGNRQPLLTWVDDAVVAVVGRGV